MQSTVQTVSTTSARLWADYLIIVLAILFVCFDHVRHEFKQGMTVEGTIQIDHADIVLFGLCLLGLLVVYMR
ncbi:MAG: hypothetical protein U0350_08975 [Caldilineaceae bacterium]